MTPQACPPSFPEADDSVLGNLVEEITNKVQAGEEVDLQLYARAHPQQEEQLRLLFSTLNVLADLARSGEGGINSPKPTLPEVTVGQLGDYQLIREVGRGGMGIVYEALQVSLGRRVALKVLPTAQGLDAKQLQRFKNEAQAAAHLHHPNIVPVHAVGCEDNVHFYAMQFIDGQTLAAFIQGLRDKGIMETPPPRKDSGTDNVGAAPPPESWTTTVGSLLREPLESGASSAGSSDSLTASPAKPPNTDVTCQSIRTPEYFRKIAQLVVQASEALEHAHQLGVIHRDIKPANLLVDERSNLWITDFGLARLQGNAGVTMTGDVVGTLRYMSPEQALGQNSVLDQRTDLYSLGVTLYELLTLEPAFPGHDRRALLRQIAFDEPSPPRRLNRAIPADLETIVLKAIAKDADGRYAAAQELADDLHRFLNDEPILARRPTLLQKAGKWARRHRAVVASTTAMAFVVLAGCLYLVSLANSRTEAQRQRAEARSDLARQAVDDMYLQAQNWLKYEPAWDPLQQEFLHRALDFYKEFAQERSDDPSIIQKTAEAYRRMAEIHHRLAKGQRVLTQRDRHNAEAEKAFIQALELFQELAGKFPHAPSYQFDLVSCQMARGEYLLEDSKDDSNRNAQAEEAFKAPIGRLEHLAADFPDWPQSRFKLAECYAKLGDTRKNLRRFPEADQAYSKALEIYQKLAAAFPNKEEYANQLAMTYINRGEMQHGLGQYQPAEQTFEDALKTLKQLTANSLVAPDCRHRLGLAHYNLGSIRSETHRPDKAEEAFRQAESHFKMLVEAYPQVPRYQGYLGDTLDRLALLHLQRGDLAKARPLAERAIDHQKRALRGSPEGFYQWFLRENLRHLAEILIKLGDHEEASRTAMEVYRTIPTCPLGRIYALQFLARCVPLAEKDAKLAPQRRQEVVKEYDEQTRKFIRNVARNPQSAMMQNDLAWFLAMCPDVRFRDPILAVTLAIQAVAQAPKMGTFWNTLGVAHYRNKDWKAAATALEKSMAIQAGGDGNDWFFMAMVTWQQGNKAEALRWYDKAEAARQTTDASDSDELRRMEEEAAALLKLRPSPMPRVRQAAAIFQAL